MTDQSLFIIKPDAYVAREEIIDQLSKDFQVTHVRTFVCDEHRTAQLYPSDRDAPYFAGICAYMREAPCTLGTVCGQQALERLLEICGRESHPDNCKVGTVRRTFGKGLEMTASGIAIVKNAIHRPKHYGELIHAERIVSSW